MLTISRVAVTLSHSLSLSLCRNSKRRLGDTISTPSDYYVKVKLGALYNITGIRASREERRRRETTRTFTILADGRRNRRIGVRLSVAGLEGQRPWIDSRPPDTRVGVDHRTGGPRTGSGHVRGILAPPQRLPATRRVPHHTPHRPQKPE
jgi:hypothetical protein